jgi:hypothetical protein
MKRKWEHASAAYEELRKAWRAIRRRKKTALPKCLDRAAGFVHRHRNKGYSV